MGGGIKTQPINNNLIMKQVIYLLIGVLIGVSGYFYSQQSTQTFGGWVDSRVLEGGTHYSTTTGSYVATVPVQILERDGSRQYAVFTNPSDTAVYLYFLDDNYAVNLVELGAGETSVTSTVTSLNGVYLAANGGTYELLDNNLVIDQVWASSTASSKQINVYYK